jgi:hypothetical protein
MRMADCRATCGAHARTATRILPRRPAARTGGVISRRVGGNFEFVQQVLLSTRTLPVSREFARGYFQAVEYLAIALQLVVALGILNVWILRPSKATPFRGVDAKNLREEFAAYGLPFWVKVGLAIALIAAIWFHRAAQPAAIGMGLLMLGAFVMHLKVRDPIKKALPSVAVLAMCAAIALL